LQYIKEEKKINKRYEKLRGPINEGQYLEEVIPKEDKYTANKLEESVDYIMDYFKNLAIAYEKINDIENANKNWKEHLKFYLAKIAIYNKNISETIWEKLKEFDVAELGTVEFKKTLDFQKEYKGTKSILGNRKELEKKFNEIETKFNNSNGEIEIPEDFFHNILWYERVIYSYKEYNQFEEADKMKEIMDKVLSIYTKYRKKINEDLGIE
jgi:hypothetical protein